MKKKISLFDVFNTLFMIVLMVVMIYPLLNVLSTSLSAAGEITAGRVTWYPRGFNLAGYRYIIEDGQIFTGYRNTVLYAGVGTLLTLTLTSLAAYALSQKELPGRRILTFYWAVTMFFGGGLVPTYLVVKSLRMLDTFWVMVLPGCVGAYTLFVFRSFMSALPRELMEAAYIDGAGDWRVWASVVIPLSKPLLATYALFTIVGHWNSWFSAMLYLKDSARYPLQMYLRRLVVQNNMSGTYANSASAALISSGEMTQQNAQMAAIVLSILPIMMIYPYIQKYFVKGVMIGSLKG